MRLRRSWLYSLILALALGTGPAQASLLSYSDSFAFNQTTLKDTRVDLSAVTATATRNFFIPLFDTALGNLTDVQILFDTSWSFSSTVQAKDPLGKLIGSHATGTSKTDMRVRLVQPKNASNKNTVERVRQVQHNHCLDNINVCRDNVDLSGIFSGSLDWTTGLALGDFLGTGDLKFSMFRKMSADLTACGYNDTCFQKNRRNNWGGNLTVNYFYDAVSVPEPPALLLMGLGLLGLGRFCRRGQQE